jgi:Cyclophilin type peptidyl-prolyl cis-trans isomerase/CLD
MFTRSEPEWSHHRYPSPFCSVPALVPALINASYETSIWDRDFENGFAGLTVYCEHGKRGSERECQFFITTNAMMPWPDKKHTTSQCVLSGLEMVHAIENVVRGH